MSEPIQKQWIEQKDCLEKTFSFPKFTDAMSFMLRVSYICERLDHHPSWENVYNRLRVRLSSHDAGDKVTDKDRALAKEMDAVYENFFS